MFFQHKETGNIYFVHERCKIKNPITREWIDAYLYSPFEFGVVMDIKYAREIEDFHKKFTRVTPVFEKASDEYLKEIDDDIIEEESIYC